MAVGVGGSLNEQNPSSTRLWTSITDLNCHQMLGRHLCYHYTNTGYYVITRLLVSSGQPVHTLFYFILIEEPVAIISDRDSKCSKSGLAPEILPFIGSVITASLFQTYVVPAYISLFILPCWMTAKTLELLVPLIRFELIRHYDRTF